MSTFTISLPIPVRYNQVSSKMLLLEFGPNQGANSDIVKDIRSRLEEIEKETAISAAAHGLMGPLILLNGSCSLPGAFVLSHHLSHLFGAIGVFDPKVNGYVVAVSHSPAFRGWGCYPRRRS